MTTEPVPTTDEAGPPETAYTDLLASFRRVQRERDEAKRVIRNAHQAIRTQTTAAAVALAMFDTGDAGTPSLLDELTQAQAEVERTREVVRLSELLHAGSVRPCRPGSGCVHLVCALWDALDALRTDRERAKRAQ